MTRVEITFVLLADDWKRAAEVAEQCAAALPMDELAIFSNHGGRVEIDMATR